MRIAVLDDDFQETEDFLDALKNWDSTRNAECFLDGATLLKAAERLPHFSVAFLDIYLPTENGIDVATSLRKISPETEIVFVTTSEEHAVEAFSLNAVHYIVKPVKTEDIREAFLRLTQRRNVRQTVSLKVDKAVRLFYTDEIMTAQSRDHLMELTLANNETVYAVVKCLELLDMLGNDFILIQRGLIVNAQYIVNMATNYCTLQNGQKILLSRKNKANIHEAYNDYVYRRMMRNHGNVLEV